MSRAAVDAILLAGGSSQRFGQPKAGTVWRGRTLADHVLSALPTRTAKTILVLRVAGDPVPIETDIVTYDQAASPEGPLSGVIAGLKMCSTPLAWVLACDLPCLKPGILELLAEVYRPGDAAVVPVWNGRLQPLCALYAVKSLARFDAVSRQGQRSLHGALGTLGFREPEPARIAAVDPLGLSFQNINTPEDLDILSSLIPESSPNPESKS